MKVTEREIRSDDGLLRAAVLPNGAIAVYGAYSSEWPDFQPYINNWLDHGTFTDLPIEWREVVSGVVWASGEWWIRLDNECDYHLYHNAKHYSYSASFDAVKSLAQQRIRGEAR